MISAIANNIYAKFYLDHLTTSSQVSKNWTRQFLACNLKFYKRKQKPFTVKCKNVHNEDDFIGYFKKYKSIQIEKSIVNKDVWNIDKTKFYVLGYGRVHWVITFDLDKPLLLTDLDN